MMRLGLAAACAALLACSGAGRPPADRARAAAADGRWEAAWRDLDRAVEAEPTSLAHRRERVRAALAAGLLPALLARLRGDEGRGPQGTYELALAVSLEGEPRSDVEALRLLERARAELTTEADVPYRQGLVLLEQERPCEAAEAFGAALAIDDRTASYHVARAAALAGCGDEGGARRALAGLAGLRPSAEDLARARAVHARMSNPLRRVPEGLRSTYGDAVASLAEEGAPGEAVQLLEEALEAAPDCAPLLTLLGLANVRLGQVARARVAFERAVALWPGDATPRIELAAIAAEAGETAEAEEHLTAALEADPLNVDALVELGRLRYGERRYSEAAEAFRRLVAVEDDSFVGRLWLGRALRRAGRDEEAEAVYLELLDSRPRTFEACVELGNIYRRRRVEAVGSARAEALEEQARRYYRLALEVRPEDPLVQRLLASLEEGE